MFQNKILWNIEIINLGYKFTHQESICLLIKHKGIDYFGHFIHIRRNFELISNRFSPIQDLDSGSRTRDPPPSAMTSDHRLLGDISFVRPGPGLPFIEDKESLSREVPFLIQPHFLTQTIFWVVTKLT